MKIGRFEMVKKSEINKIIESSPLWIDENFISRINNMETKVFSAEKSTNTNETEWVEITTIKKDSIQLSETGEYPITNKPIE